MAPTLTSNSFIFTTAPHSRQCLRKIPRVGIFAKKSGPFSPFQLGKSKDESPSSEPESTNSSPFKFKFNNSPPDFKSLIPILANPSSGLSFQRGKDPATVFVAGATGQAGIRIAQTLLREGFSVRAGVPELGAAQDLARFASAYKIISKDESKRLNAVESTFKDAELIAKAIGNAGKVVVTIGPTENGPAAEVSPSDALRVIEAAQLAGVGHVAIVYDSSTGGSTYNVLDGFTLFFNNIFSRSQPLTIPEFLQKVIETDLSYTFIKTSLTDDFAEESSYNVVVSAEGSLASNRLQSNVAKSQIASLVAKVFSNTSVAENKVVEVFTDPSAPSKSVDELFSGIPEDGRRKAFAEALAKKKAEEEASIAAEKAREAANAAKKLEEEVRKLTEQEAKATNLAKEAEEKAEAAGAPVESLLSRAKGIGAASGLGLSLEKLSSQIASVNEILQSTVQVATVRGEVKARSLTPQKAVVKPKQVEKPKPKPKAEEKSEQKKEVKKLFGGLFQQETIYIDDD